MNTISKLVRGALVMTAAAAACAAVSRPANAQVIFFDNFNLGTTGLNYDAFPNWTVSNGTVDLIGAGGGPGAGFDFYPGNGQYVDLDGTFNNAATFTSTSFVLGPGVYDFSFSLGKNGSALESMQVSIGSAYSETFANTGSIGSFQTIFRTFTVASGTTVPIVFNHAGGDNSGFVIDNVRLSVSVPEPSTVALMMGPAALLLGGVMVRRRRNA